MRFLRSDSGYALVLTLLFMPVFVGMALLVIDISRGNNANSDLQAAADALALAGARELDGGVDSIDRAIAAMRNIDNTVSFLGQTDENAAIMLTFGAANDPDEYAVVFLSGLPASDDEAINFDLCVTNDTSSTTCATDQSEARFIFVRAQSEDLNPFFGLFFPGANPVADVPIAAEAVATYREVACQAPPLFMCNPVPTGATGYPSIVDAFNAGWFHARLIKLRLGSNTGNFGFLNLGDLLNVGNLQLPAYRQILTTEQELDGCNVTLDALETRTGQITSLDRWFNTRFGLYSQNQVRGIASDEIVRKGFVLQGNQCDGDVDDTFSDMVTDTSIDPGDFNTSNWRYDGDRIDAMGFPSNYSTEFSSGSVEVGGTTRPSGANGYVWPYDFYLGFNYPTQAASIASAIAPQAYPAGDIVRNPNLGTPSRHDVYAYERANVGTLGNNVRNSDPLVNSCSSARPSVRDGRYMYVAFADCDATPPTGTSVPLRIIAYGKFFLTTPVIDDVIAGEIVDLTNEGLGTTDLAFRDEAFLVR
ncbi:hypothetical protein A8B83_05955 [Rhodobacteraceae bacterium EhC02]|jgi:Flp pilus assembly protein TadG|nr:hypothetical protein A8B83_05955 [Rhodobacteraceae bacterium EhC02]